MRSLTVRIAAVLCLLVTPIVASAQTSTISGTVKDASGGVLPGVTVEAASPVLIEKSRSTVTSGSGTGTATGVTSARIYTSTNSGASWTQASGTPTNVSWTCAASSADGRKLAVAAELAPKVRVNCVAPSLLDTKMAAPLMPMPCVAMPSPPITATSPWLPLWLAWGLGADV